MITQNDIINTQFSASIGIEVIIQIEKTDERFKGTLIGINDDQYLILAVNQPKKLGQKFTEGRELILRYVYFGSVYGCLCNVIKYISDPYPILFVSFPSQAQSLELRKKKRIACLLPATVMVSEGKEDGVIRDISSGGVLFCTKIEREKFLLNFKIGETVILNFPLLGKKGVQEFAGKIRHINQDEKEISLGIEFEELSSEKATIINSYINKVIDYIN